MLNYNLIYNKQAYFWTKRWQEGEKEADEDNKAARIVFSEADQDIVKDSD
jgi:hypothetical protein